MLSEAGRRLESDHQSLGELLKTLQMALVGGDLKATHSHLDSFWARLAVHIRAEHLHLFPSVLDSLAQLTDHSDSPSVSEAEKIIEELRHDHDFFMRQLSSAMMLVRELLTLNDQFRITAGLEEVAEIVAAVEQRLCAHNKTEEQMIYRWISAVLDSETQALLNTEVKRELANLPPRFGREAGNIPR